MRHVLIETTLPEWFKPEDYAQLEWYGTTPTYYCLRQRGHYLLLIQQDVAALTTAEELATPVTYRLGIWGMTPVPGSILIVRQLGEAGFEYHARQIVLELYVGHERLVGWTQVPPTFFFSTAPTARTARRSRAVIHLPSIP